MVSVPNPIGQGPKPGKMGLAMTVFAAFGGFLFGYDTGYISGVKEMPIFAKLLGVVNTNPATMAKAPYVLTSGTNALITSILSAGTFVGALLAYPADTTSSSDAAALANLQADYAALVAKITRLEASQSAASAPAKQEKPTDGMPSTIVVPEAYMLKGRENFVEWDGFLNMFLPDDVYNYLTGGRDNVKWTDAYYARGQEYASRVLIASIDPICSSDIIPIRQMKGTAHECWLELASRYRPSDAQAAATLVGEFWNLPPIPTTESGFNQ
ncbi:BZ3500_MvSof-1268-A1-R1_Chr9g10495 [Microbotryum saponariae]|uniref:BZ3500_MvSof-1268-A1-R1_Chr9g10495 protein n=1 Tax=Microbotryum saponariae TaxID=289078 RepID=A0A2X0LMD8_9BASI|nr:BZ3501_MvSof-1269-A2-R1_Chr9g10244 [Microbotryum saponariae]SDA00193.1 BZ3500_MvSof-1268-A1-R1_Chr9g10495 [Microbotryum saponariae]